MKASRKDAYGLEVYNEAEWAMLKTAVKLAA